VTDTWKWIKKIFFCLFAILVLAVSAAVPAPLQKPFRIGVVHEGGELNRTVDGLKDGYVS